MMENNINEIISNSLNIDKENLNNNIKNIISQIKNEIFDSKDEILQKNYLDSGNDNGFIIDFKFLNDVFENLENEEFVYGNIIKSENSNNIIDYIKVADCGNVVVINDGNPYVIIEMIIRNIMAGNTSIFSNDGFMSETNNHLVSIVHNVLDKFSISKYLVQMYISDNFDNLLSNYANIDLVICIGNQSLQRLVLNKSKNKTLVSGYTNFDIYIDDKEYINIFNKINEYNLNVQFYVKSDIEFDDFDSIIVEDIEEAISQLNYNGSRYCSVIFTNSLENATKFVNDIKAKFVSVNIFPNIGLITDIKQTDLFIEKKICSLLELSN